MSSGACLSGTASHGDIALHLTAVAVKGDFQTSQDCFLLQLPCLLECMLALWSLSSREDSTADLEKTSRKGSHLSL